MIRDSHTEYTRFFLKAGSLAAPFLLLAMGVYWADPFCLFGSPFIAREVKERSAFPLNTCLTKLIAFRHAPNANILLGDSRMGLIRPEEIERVSGAKFINLSYGGASLNEMVDTFWTANKAVPLKVVYMGFGFSLYNDYNFTNRTEPAMAIIDTPLLYFTNITVLKGAFYTARLRYAGTDPGLGLPTITREELWADELQTHSNWAERYLKPVRYRSRLEEISQYCREKGIDLRFIVFPGHADLQAIPSRFGLDDQYFEFKRDLARFGPLYDFDVPNAQTANRENYKDPVHFREPIARGIVEQIWGGGR